MQIQRLIVDRRRRSARPAYHRAGPKTHTCRRDPHRFLHIDRRTIPIRDAAIRRIQCHAIRRRVRHRDHAQHDSITRQHQHVAATSSNRRITVHRQITRHRFHQHVTTDRRDVAVDRLGHVLSCHQSDVAIR